ncbi:MAG: hypothetical protein H0U44_12760 [Flavisolibacter sp.]|jgi:hypothetical protein|nr:hypothetical protein [Flavisolibacter sp.]
MKTLLSQVIASGNPLRISRAIDDRMKRTAFLIIAWMNKKKYISKTPEMVNNPLHWDVEWFNNYE